MSGRLCPVCLRPARAGACAEHGPWMPHQLVSARDRRCAARMDWRTFRPLAHACPRCLAAVAESRGGWACLDHGHDVDAHGPFRVDELLGTTAQRESARRRATLARRERRAQRPAVTVALPDLSRHRRLVTGAGIMAATLAYLVR